MRSPGHFPPQRLVNTRCLGGNASVITGNKRKTAAVLLWPFAAECSKIFK